MTSRLQIKSLCSGRNSAALATLLLAVSSATAGIRWEAKSSWTNDGQAWIATGPVQPWDVLLSRTKQQDGSFSAVVRILQKAGPGATDSGWSGTDEFAPDYEAGLVFRHTGDRYYRVCLSTLHKEVALWRTDGGWLAVRGVDLTTNTDYRLRVDFSGNRIKVSIDDKEQLDVTDVHPLLDQGNVGLAVKQGATRFSAVELKAIQPLGTGPTTPDFTQKKWHGQDWFFNGLEPIARLDADLKLHTKLAPCFRTIGYFNACWIRYSDLYANQKAKFTVQETGPRLKCLLEGMGPNGEIVSQYLMTLSLDAGTMAYVYDFDAQFTVQPGKTWPGLEFTDYWPCRVVGPGTQGQEDQWPHNYQWIAWQNTNGLLYKYPINHNGFYPGYGGKRECLNIATNGGFIGFFNEDVNPVWRIVKAQADVGQGLCAWGFDLHLAYATPKEYPLKAGTQYSLQFQLTGYDRARGNEILKTATLPPDAEIEDLDWEYPAYQWGLNDFRTGVKLASPHQEQIWRRTSWWLACFQPSNVWDRTVGYDDKASLRLDGPFSIGAGMGPSWFMPAFSARRYFISAIVKTENVRGEGPFIAFACQNNKAARDRFATGITGTRRWTRVGFVTTNLTGLIQGDLRVGLSGTGKAWFDNVEIHALTDDEQPVLPKWEKAPAVTPMPDTLIWLKMDDMAGAGALDDSHRGHSAELVGLKWVQDEVKGPCLEFDGKGCAVIEDKTGNDLDLAMPFSFSCWIKPAATGPSGGQPIFGKNSQFWLWLGQTSTNAPTTISFLINRRDLGLTTPAVVRGGVWSHLAVTHDKQTIRIYLNGTKVGEKAQPEDKLTGTGDVPLCIGAFYGPTPNGDSFRGRMAEVKFLGKAFSDMDIRNEYEAGKPVKQ